LGAKQMGLLELLIIVFVGLLLFAPRKLPALGASFGQAVRGFKHGLHGETDRQHTTPKDRDKN